MFPPVREAGRQDQPDMVAARHTCSCRCWLGVPCLGVRPASPRLWGPRAPAVPRLLPAVDLPHPPRCCWRSASCVTVLSRRPGGRAGPEGVASDCCLLPEVPQRRGPLSPAQEPCGVSCVCRVGPA